MEEITFQGESEKKNLRLPNAAEAENCLKAWEKSEFLKGADAEQDKLTLAILLENTRLTRVNLNNPLFSNEQVFWLVQHSWLKSRFRKMISIQPMLGPTHLVYYKHSNQVALDSAGVASKTLSLPFQLFRKAKFSSIKEVYADSIASFLDIEILKRLPKLKLTVLQDLITTGVGTFNIKEAYDYIIAPKDTISQLEQNKSFGGIDFFETPIVLDEKTFELLAAAGKYTKSSLELPIFCPYVPFLETPLNLYDTASILTRLGWFTEDDVKTL